MTLGSVAIAENIFQLYVNVRSNVESADTHAFMIFWKLMEDSYLSYLIKSKARALYKIAGADKGDANRLPPERCDLCIPIKSCPSCHLLQ